MFLDPNYLRFFQDIIYLNILKWKQSFLLPKIADLPAAKPWSVPGIHSLCRKACSPQHPHYSRPGGEPERSRPYHIYRV